MSNKNKRVMILDALNLFLRAYIVNPTISKEGAPIGGTVGFIKSLQKLCREIKPDKVVICWDGRSGSRKRKQINKNYKEGRSPIRLNRAVRTLSETEEKENKIWQMYRLVEYLNLFPVIQLVTDEVEADDIIAYICKQSQYKDYQKVIVSSDKDFYQLLDDNTVLHRPVQDAWQNANRIIEEFGIHPNNFALARAMAGDTSDNLSGIGGVGLKTVKKRFPFFAEEKSVMIPDLVTFCENQNQKVKAFTAVIEGVDIIKENYKIMQLYSPLLSVQAKTKFKWAIDNFELQFNKTEFDLLLLEDGLGENSWFDLVTFFRKMCLDNKAIK